MGLSRKEMREAREAAIALGKLKPTGQLQSRATPVYAGPTEIVATDDGVAVLGGVARKRMRKRPCQ